jgi:hypothetical protein
MKWCEEKGSLGDGHREGIKVSHVPKYHLPLIMTGICNNANIRVHIT